MAYRVIFFDLGGTLVQPGAGWLPGAKESLAALRAAGFQLGVISNTPAGITTRQQLNHLLPSDFTWDLFDSPLALLSFEVGVSKPELEIFRRAVSNAGVPAAECLYCSEDLFETLAAQKAGLHSFRLQPPPTSEMQTLPQTLQRLAAL
jgi:FMN phosphatase YigB (HAD superfamily)